MRTFASTLSAAEIETKGSNGQIAWRYCGRANVVPLVQTSIGDADVLDSVLPSAAEPTVVATVVRFLPASTARAMLENSGEPYFSSNEPRLAASFDAIVAHS